MARRASDFGSHPEEAGGKLVCIAQTYASRHAGRILGVQEKMRLERQDHKYRVREGIVSSLQAVRRLSLWTNKVKIKTYLLEIGVYLVAILHVQLLGYFQNEDTLQECNSLTDAGVSSGRTRTPLNINRKDAVDLI